VGNVIRKAIRLLVWFLVLLSNVLLAQQKEPIRLHPQNPHYFLWNGKATALVGSGEHYGAVLNRDFDYKRYLQTIESDGMNYTRLFGGSYVEVPAKSFGILRNDLGPAPGRLLAPWARSDVAGYAVGGNKFDLARWDTEYFSRLREFMAEAVRHGIVVELTLFSSQYGDLQWNVSPLNSANNINHTDAIDWKKLNTLENGNILQHQEKYVRRLVHEVNEYPNVIFEIANEPWSDRGVLADVVNPYLFTGRDKYPNSVDLADELSLAWQARVSDWITSEEANMPNKHLIAQNCCNFFYPVRNVVQGASILSFHYAYPEAVSMNYGLGKVISYDETGFLGRDDDVYARQAWNFMLSGGGVFDNLDYSFSVGHEDGLDSEANGPGGGSSALRNGLRILSEFLKGLPLVEMQPDANVVKHAGGVWTHTLSNASGQYAMYVDGDGPAEVELRLPAGEYSFTWIDIATGSTKGNGTLQHSGGDYVMKTPEFRRGIALKLWRNQRRQ
jgi:hypothetical protein